MDIPGIKRDVDRARRIIGGLSDEQSVRTLWRYVAELEAQLQEITAADASERRA